MGMQWASSAVQGKWGSWHLFRHKLFKNIYEVVEDCLGIEVSPTLLEDGAEILEIAL